VAASAATRDNFGKSAKGLVEASGFDGIDSESAALRLDYILTFKQVDWEHPSNAEQGRDFLALLAAIRLHLPDDRYLLTAALPAGQWALQNIDLYKAQDYLDLLNLMAYDFTGSWSQKAGHHAQLFSGNSSEASGSAAVDYVICTGFPAAKILLGVPVYGRSFLGATGPGQSYEGLGGEGGTFEYKQLPRPGTEEVVNTRVVAAFCIGGDGGFVSYDNPETVKMKAKYCIERGLGVSFFHICSWSLARLTEQGLFYWTGTADTPPGPRSLISAGFKALHGSS
jgi:chitinase